MGLLWFRRSRGKDTKPEPEFERPAEPHFQPQAQSRLPLRIRGLLLLNLRPSDGAAQIESAPPLGRRDDVIRALRGVMPGMQFTPHGRGELDGRDHRVTIDVGPQDVVHAAVATAEGDAGVELLRAAVERLGWRVYVPRAGTFIEPDALELFALSGDSPL